MFSDGRRTPTPGVKHQPTPSGFRDLTSNLLSGRVASQMRLRGAGDQGTVWDGQPCVAPKPTAQQTGLAVAQTSPGCADVPPHSPAIPLSPAGGRCPRGPRVFG